jgi:hypothetical protein
MSSAAPQPLIESRPLIVRLWEEIQRDRSEPNASGSSPASNQSFESILQIGLRLQACLDRGMLEDAGKLARQLEPLLENGDRGLKQLAAYHLWPWYARQYYGEPPASEAPDRRAARQGLCRIQEILYEDVPAVLGILRRSFEVYDDEELRPYLGGNLRARWRPQGLTSHCPDLCAVDQLAIHLLDLEQAHHDIMEAEKILHEACLSHEPISKADCRKILAAFHKLHVAQLTVFLPVKETFGPTGIPVLREITCHPDVGPQRTALSAIIPFHVQHEGQWIEDPSAAQFRRLADFIYSCTDSGRFRAFVGQKNLTLSNPVTKALRFISDAVTTLSFLTNEASLVGHPRPYRRVLTDLGGGAPICDWTDDAWWADSDDEKLRQQLLGSTNGKSLHACHHWSALWDYLAGSESPDLPAEPDKVWRAARRAQVSAKQRFGYLMELLLRIRRPTASPDTTTEPLARTSLFCGITQSFESAAGFPQDRFMAFIGGTLLGVEAPGIPFAEVRFKAIEKRVRGLLITLASYCQTRLDQAERERQKLRAVTFSERVASLLTLYKAEQPPFYDTAHSKDEELLNRVLGLGMASHLKCCSENMKTLKALFAVGTAHERWDSLEPKAMAYEPVPCTDCFQAFLKYLLNFDLSVSATSNRPELPAIWLPARPGIRFVIALGEFLWRVQSEYDEERNKIAKPECLRFHRADNDFDLKVVFTNGQGLVSNLNTYFHEMTFRGVSGALWRLIDFSRLLEDRLRDVDSRRREVLTGQKFAQSLRWNFLVNEGAILLTWSLPR